MRWRLSISGSVRSQRVSHRLIEGGVLCVCLFALGGGALARDCRVNLLPNGSKFRCLNCHTSANGGGANNPFGATIQPVTGSSCTRQFWTPALAALDSDGDGLTNGEELGDPEGLWEQGDPAPGDSAQVTNPGDRNSPPQKPTLTAVEPAEISTLGGTAMTIRGTNFTAATTATIGGVALVAKNVSGTTVIRGRAPAMKAGEAPGPRDVEVKSAGGTATLSAVVTYVAPPPLTKFIRADFNSDGSIDIADPVATLAALFHGAADTTCKTAADSNADLQVTIADAIFTLDHLFLGGPPPGAPYPACGELDTTLGCVSSKGCP